MESSGEVRERWKRIILEADASGFSAREWCRQHQIPYGTFKGWRAAFVKSGEFSFDVCNTRWRNRENWKKRLLEADASGLM